MYLVKQMTDASLSEIGREFGGKHHTTVMHSIAKVHELRRSDAALDRAISKLLTSLKRR
jgi:chromosomal replication initiator protein